MTDRMYADTVTWNPFKGCEFNCSYCKPSFQAQAKRQKHNCQDCYYFWPHEHPERLGKIPNAKRIFVCGNGDIAFCSPQYLLCIVDAVRDDSEKHPEREYYFQSKRPYTFWEIAKRLPKAAIILTTLETNRNLGYAESVGHIAPLPTDRYRSFDAIDYPRKMVTVEPIMDFDLHTFAGMLIDLAPEAVWIGYNSRPKQVQLPEPSEAKVVALIDLLLKAGIRVKAKDLRGIVPQSGLDGGTR